MKCAEAPDELVGDLGAQTRRRPPTSAAGGEQPLTRAAGEALSLDESSSALPQHELALGKDEEQAPGGSRSEAAPLPHP
jgi:hypothetical protein